MRVGKKKISCYSIKSLSTLAIRHLFVVYANEKSHTVYAIWLLCDVWLI